MLLYLRAIARRMEITAPAVHNYFPRLEDLITALTVDAFNDLADAMQAAGQSVTSNIWGPKIKAAILAYRRWAVAHPVEFQLIYGDPIPGYAAPAEVTSSVANQPFVILYGYFAEALKTWYLLRLKPSQMPSVLRGLKIPQKRCACGACGAHAPHAHLFCGISHPG